MKKWLVGYWKYKNDQWEDREKEIEAINFDDAYKNFRIFAPNLKIRYIQEIN
jgi:nitrogen fixation-related uncharacterized protein